jgi:hypothetical protein
MEPLRELAVEVPEGVIGPWCSEKAETGIGLSCTDGWQEPISEASRPARRFPPTWKWTKDSQAGIQS